MQNVGSKLPTTRSPISLFLMDSKNIWKGLFYGGVGSCVAGLF